jgi:hypothetical protein
MFSDRAMDCALAPGDPTDAVYLLMRKSNIACDPEQASSGGGTRTGRDETSKPPAAGGAAPEPPEDHVI